MLTYDQSMSNVVSLISIVIPISLVLEDINDDEKPRILNELKTEINSGLVNIKFEQGVSGRDAGNFLLYPPFCFPVKKMIKIDI